MIEFHYGISVYTERNVDGFVTMQPDYYGDDAGGPPLESASPFGLVSTPRDPDVDASGHPSVGAGLLYFHHGDDSFAIPTQDPRYFVKVPDHGKGGATLYAALKDGAWTDTTFVQLHGDGGVKIRAPYSAGAKEMLFELDAANDRIRVTASDSTYIEVSGGVVTLGNVAGAQPVALAQALQTWAAGVNAALASAGFPAAPLSPSVAATKAKAV